MTITILAVGSRGDVQPYITLGVRLQQRGHQVRIGALETFRALVSNAGLTFTPLGDLPAAAQRADAETPGKSSTRFAGPSGRVRFWLTFPRLIEANANAFVEACAGTDLIVHSRLALPAPHIAERLGVPCIAAYAAPTIRTREFAHPYYLRDTGESRARIAASYQLDWYLTNQLPLAMLNRLRVRMGLGAVSRRALRSWLDQRVLASLFLYSPSVVPRPRDWPDNAHVTGFWYEAAQTRWCPPAALRRFLDEGPPPLTIGFGSMVPKDSAAVTRVLAEALALTGQRAVLLSGWAKLQNDSTTDRLLTVDTAPHSWLFPRAAAAIHHGGAGTCAAALRAGIPSVIVPFAFDQHFWARRLHDLGVAPAPVPIGQLTVARVAAAIDIAIRDEAMKAQAERLAATMAREDGLGQSVDLIESYVSGRQPVAIQHAGLTAASLIRTSSSV